MNKKILTTLFLAGLITACGGAKEAEKKEGEAKPVAKTAENQELNLFLGAEPKTLDVSKATDTYASTLLALNNEGLVAPQVQPDGSEKIVPAGAESWTVSEDGMKFTFKLRPDAVWTDGKKVTAHDYVYGIQRTLDPATGSLYSFILAPIKGAEAYTAGKGKVENLGVKALDDTTLEITLEKPTAYFLELAYFKVAYPQRKDIVEKSGEKYGSEADTLISNGPFVIKEWVHSNKVVAEKSPTYWDKDNVKLNKITLQIVPDENARMQLILNGQVDSGAVMKPEWMQKFNDMKAFQYLSQYALGTNYTNFNTKDPLFQNVKVRKAFSLATNREEINTVMFEGIHEPAYGWVSKGIKIDGKEYRDLVPEPIKAMKDANQDPVALLKEGLKELGLPEDPSKVTVTYLSASTSPWSRKYAEYLQQMYKKNLGIEVKADFVEWPVFQKMQQELTYQFAGQAWMGDYNDPSTFLDMWTSTAGIVNNGWKNPEYDKLIAKAQSTSNQNERLDLFKQAEKMLLDDQAVLAPTLYRRTSTYVRNYVKGYNPPTLSTNYNFKGVYIEGKK